MTDSKKKLGRKSRLFGDTLLSADHAHEILNSRCDDLRLDALVLAEGPMEIEAALWKLDENNRAYVLRRWGTAIAMWIKEKKYPKENRRAILRHLADSIAGEANVSPRRSRDICDRLRRERRGTGNITRREFYVECSCGFKGPALQDVCPKCGGVSFI